MVAESNSQLKKKTGELSSWIDGDISIDTIAVHGGTKPDNETGAVLTPIYQSTTFIQPSVEEYLSKGFSYTRQSNPTVRALESRIAALENGLDCVCVGSGMAATTTVFSAFLKTGDHCILPNCSYGGTNRCARIHFSKYKIEFSYIDMTDVKNIEKAIQPNTKMIFTETTSNPTLKLADIEAVSSLCKKRGILHVCDSTFSTPVALRPIDVGADITLHSLTKYFDGHNMIVGGALIVKNKEHYEMLSLQRNILGNILTPNSAFSILQTVKTMVIRFKKQSETAMMVAERLQHHPRVESVSYPGLKSHPQHELAKKQYNNNMFGGMIAFEVKGGKEAGIKLMNTVKRPWSLCENLGAIESIITCPSVFTHANMLEEDRLRVGITDGLIRLSVGLESGEDLIKSLYEALDNL